MSIIKLPSGKWRLQIRRKNLRLDSVFDTKKEAREAEEAALARTTKKGERTVAALWNAYEQSQLFDDKSEETKKTERTRIKPVLERLGNYSVEELEANTGIIYDYIDARSKVVSAKTKKRLSKSSVRLEIAALSAAVEFAKRRQLIRANFVRNISRPVGKKRKRRVEPEEQGRLSVYARNENNQVARAARFLLLLRQLGCRPGELRNLLREDIRLQRSELTFRDTKNQTDRSVHITSGAAQLIHLQLNSEEGPWLFNSYARNDRRRQVPYNYASGVDLLRELGIISKDMHAHAGRREFISRAIEASVPYATIKKQTGHKSVQALEIYDEGLSTAPEIRAVLDKLDATVSKEMLKSIFEAAGLSKEQLENVLEKTFKEKSWTNPFSS